MNMKQWLETYRTAPVKQSMPVLFLPCTSLMKVTVSQICGSAELHAEGIRRVADRVPSAAAVSMMDLSVEAEAFGSAICFADDEVPTVTGRVIEEEMDADNLRVPEVGEGRTGRSVEAVRLACASVTDRPVLAGSIGPFSLAGRLMGVSEAMANCYDEPETVEKTLEKATAFLIPYIKAFRDVGANGVMIAEPLTGMLSPRLAEEFSEEYVRRIAEAVKRDDFLVIYHNCGNNVARMSDSIARTNCDAYHFGDAVRMKNMLDCMPADVPVMGNVSPSAQFLNGTPESIRGETLRIMNECCREHPNFLISSGCDIPPTSPWENIDAFFAAVAEYYRN
jgi:uroporphyrinogen decarboxylase